MAPMALDSMPRRDGAGGGGSANESHEQGYHNSFEASFANLTLNDEGLMAPYSLPSLDTVGTPVLFGGSRSFPVGMSGGAPRGGSYVGSPGGYMDPQAPQYEPMSQHHLATGGAGVLISSPGGRYQIKRCQGFVRCDMDIESEVVGWVIGKNGSTIKDMKHKTGCNMWVDQRALKLTITGPDVAMVENAAKGVEAYVAAAPIKAGAVEAAVTRNLDCPPHLLDVLGDRATIARIVKETRAQVVVNKKMMRVIVRGNPHAVDAACDKVSALIAQALVDEQEQRGRAEAKAYQQLIFQHQRWLAARGLNTSLSVGGMPPGVDLERDRMFSSEAESEGGDAESVISYASLGSTGGMNSGALAGMGSGSATALRAGVDFSPASSGQVSPRLAGSGGSGSGAGGQMWSLFSGSFSGSSALQDAVGGAGSASPVGPVGSSPTTSSPGGTPVGSPVGVPTMAGALPPGLGLPRAAHNTAPTSPLAPVAEEGESASEASSNAALAVNGSATNGSSSSNSNGEHQHQQQPRQQQQRGNGAASLPRPVDKELFALLEELGLGKYSGSFGESEVDVEALSLMEERDLADLGIPKGPRLKILNAIRRQRRSSEAEDSA